MYEKFYGLKEMPFTVMPDPRFAFRSWGHKLAEGRMRHAATYRSGLAVLTGPIGCGKTTIANMLVRDWEDDATKAVAYLPTADDRGRAAFMKRVLDGFGVASTARTYADNRDLLERFLLDTYKADKHAVLVIDEGQKIHADNFDTLTDLTNFQTATEKFLTIILFAQDNLAAKLIRKDAFTSRIAFTGHLDPLTYDDMRGMIAHRLRVGGAKVPGLAPDADGTVLPDLSTYLTQEALLRLYEVTKGTPRDVCILLSQAFLDSYIANERPVSVGTIESTVTEMKRLKKWPVREAK